MEASDELCTDTADKCDFGRNHIHYRSLFGGIPRGVAVYHVKNRRYSYGIPVFCMPIGLDMLPALPEPALAGDGVGLYHHDDQHIGL